MAATATTPGMIIVPKKQIIVLKENDEGKFDVLLTFDNINYLKIGTIKDPKNPTVNPFDQIKTYVDDYGGGFANFTPPSDVEEGTIIYAEDTNTTTPGKRLYVYANGKWSYVALT